MNSIDKFQRYAVAPQVKDDTAPKAIVGFVIYMLWGVIFWFIALYAALHGLVYSPDNHIFVALPNVVGAVCFAALGATSFTEAFTTRRT